MGSYEILDETLAGRINADLERFVREWKAEESIGNPEPIDAFCSVMLRGGKRLRGVLAMQSYLAHGGRNDAVAIGAARVFEIIQTSLLVVDDIADRSVLRRGGSSAHKQIEAYARAHDMKGGAQHYGIAQGMNVAYAGLHKVTTELLELPVPAEIARRASVRFHENILTTINGQIDDIFNEATRELLNETAVERVLARKTPHYTILGPLELGAQLAGRELPQSLRDYSLHAGIAYQIADDIISTFGMESETGKGSNDDIREGKMTLLAYFALRHGSERQKETLRTILGSESATQEECDEARTIFEQTGALQFAKDRQIFHEKRALAALKTDTQTEAAFINYLRELADYLVNRRS